MRTNTDVEEPFRGSFSETGVCRRFPARFLLEEDELEYMVLVGNVLVEDAK